MKVSVVTIVYNDVNGIGRTLRSVNDQTVRGNIEYIVVDGASTDGSREILNDSCDRIDVLISEPDKGIYDAMNKGLAAATGDYVIFMNSGDCFSDTYVVENIIEKIKESALSPAIVYGTYRESREGIVSSPIPCRSPKKIWYGPVASHQSTFYNLAEIRRHGLSYDLTYRIAADYKFTLSLLTLSGGNGMPTDVCVSDFDISGASNQNQNLGLEEANRARREVLGWSRFRTGSLTVALLGARYMKRYLNPVYRYLRNR